mgnify:CR=1 FL=1
MAVGAKCQELEEELEERRRDPCQEICEEFDPGVGVGVGKDICIPEGDELDIDQVVRSISAQNLVIDDDDDTHIPEP